MVKRQKKSLNAFTFRLTLAESQGFEPWVPFGDTAFRVLHLRPLGQLSIQTAIVIISHTIAVCQSPIYKSTHGQAVHPG